LFPPFFFLALLDHSDWNKEDVKTVCGMGMCPISTKFKGPSPKNNSDKPDVIDEALKFFKANVLFRNFEVLGPADKTIIYLTLFISEALQKLGGHDLESAKKEMYSLSIQDFWVPGHANWPLAGFTTKPANRG
jgi:actin related protein 2/3 complex subunit 3